MTDARPDVTALLGRWRQGEAEALNELLPMVYEEVRFLAHRLFAGEPGSHTLQTTALVSEVYLELAGMKPPRCVNRGQLIGFLAKVMRHILVDHARRRRSLKRGGDIAKVSIDEKAGEPLDSLTGLTLQRREELLDVDRALIKLEKEDPRLARVVELRWFLGLTTQEMADSLGVSRDTVSRDLTKAKAWLKAEIRQHWNRPE